MLKKLCCCVLSVLLLCACSAPEKKEAPPSPTMVQEVLLPMGTPQPTAEPEEQSVPSGILALAEPMEGNETLYRIPNVAIGQGIQQKLLLHQGSLLVFGIGAECSLKQLSLDTGEVLNERTFAGFEVPHLEPCGDALALTDWADGDILLLDAALQTENEYKVQASYGAMCLSPDGERAYSFSTEGILATELASGGSAMLPDASAMVMAAGFCDGGMALS